jgi:hypothetical protein
MARKGKTSVRRRSQSIEGLGRASILSLRSKNAKKTSAGK